MIERRPFPRYQIELPLEVFLGESQGFTGMGRDISRSGIGLELARDAVEALAQSGSVLNTGDRFHLTMEMQPPGAGRLVAECHTSFVRRLSQDRYIVGARFLNLDGGEARYEAFLAWCAAASQ